MKAVIFDLDQTLLDREQSLISFAKWQCRGMLRTNINDENLFIARFIELDANGTVWKDRVYESLISEFEIQGWSVPELLSVYELCFCGFSVPKNGVRDALDEISKNYKLGLISNGMTPFQERNFQSLGFASQFESIIVSQAVDIRKPDPRIFELSCKELGIDTSEAIYVGDNPVADIEGARDTGLHTIFIPSSVHSKCSIADAICSDMRQLPQIINGFVDP
ncbi:Pyrimidine 5'-nucleotidase YjjG [Acaryochloris thomasi RCC1774]|uniref:Pyrimidine 5'-nucleotidase YjjG n=1 Tax=Acaryochloris thomasi RCC1774 TaxID=1764569 RepID=A0A2W1J9L0_9CYAN|nr:HAD family hydrolase [Acaryochloris thomasi]PZD70736.1 Pyrimidine 5'-nucleotidase YjjG [Acaryochloris thomasi RCC1774]